MHDLSEGNTSTSNTAGRAATHTAPVLQKLVFGIAHSFSCLRLDYSQWCRKLALPVSSSHTERQNLALYMFGSQEKKKWGGFKIYCIINEHLNQVPMGSNGNKVVKIVTGCKWW